MKWTKKANFRVKLPKIISLRLFQRQNVMLVVREYPKTTRFVFLHTFTPTFQYFYTEISAISVTFCNSECEPHASSLHVVAVGGISLRPLVDKHRLNGSRLEFQLTETVAEYLTIAIRSLICQGRTNWTKKYIFEKTNGKSITLANLLKEVLYDNCFIRFKQSNPQ